MESSDLFKKVIIQRIKSAPDGLPASLNPDAL